MNTSTLSLSMNRLAALVLTAIIAVTAPGCAAVVSNLPVVIAAVTDALMVLDSIEKFVGAYFIRRPDADLQAKVESAMSRTRSALNAALRIANGAEKLDQAKIDEAFAEFRKAYADLLVLLTPLGVTSGDSLRATPNGLAVPQPLALTVKARK